MAKKTSPTILRWVDICRAWRLAGIMKNYSKGECFRVRKLLEIAIEQGKIRQIARGRYELLGAYR